MDSKFQIEVEEDSILIWETNWKGRTTLAAEVFKGATMQQIAQEFYEIISASGQRVEFLREILMIKIHIQQTDSEIVVSQLDCVIARLSKVYCPYSDDTVEFIAEVLQTLGHSVEVC